MAFKEKQIHYYNDEVSMHLHYNDNFVDFENIEAVTRETTLTNNPCRLKSQIRFEHYWYCNKCDYSCGGKNASTMKLMVRLHKKKCNK